MICMPLPDAKPDPKKANIYEQLSSIKASDLKRTQLDIIRDPLFLNAESEDVLRRILLIGQVTDQLSTSGPIPRTQQIIQTTYTDTGDDADFFVPGVGEVWQILGGDTSASGGTGSINWSLKDSDGTLALIFQTSVNGQEPIFQNSNNNNIPSPIYVTSDNWLYANITAVATNVRASISFIRVR
jgi:hypothetical protein